jgi:hypothetical protein
MNPTPRPAARHQARPGIHPNDYSEAEHALLVAHYPQASRADVLAALPGRTWCSIQGHAIRTQVRRHAYRTKPWTAADVALLQARYATTPTAELAARLGRTAQAVKMCAVRLRLTAERRGPRQQPPRPPRAKAVKPTKPPKPTLVLKARAAAKPKPKPMAPDPAKGKALPTPGLQTNAGTPNLNAAKAARKAAQQAAKRPVVVTAAELSKYDYAHPARQAYNRAAHLGGHVAQQAFHAALKALAPC